MDKKIIEVLKEDTRKLIHDFKTRNLAKILKFYEIVIEIQKTRIPLTKREIYYRSVNVFKSQKSIDLQIKRAFNIFGFTSINLLISASLKGLFSGPVSFRTENNIIKNSLLIPDISTVIEVITTAKIIVVVEKDSFFSHLIQEIKGNTLLEDIIWVCGKGYPDYNTINFLKLMENRTKIYGIFDCDPYGLNIFLTYKNGTVNNPIRLNMQRIGITAKDISKYKINDKELIKLNNSDIKMIQRLRDCKDDGVNGDMRFLQGLGSKMEIEILSAKGNGFLVKYLTDKLLNAHY